MLADSRKITKGLVIYSVLISDYEKLDFKNDALAGVRANFFNSNQTPQRDKTEITFDNKIYSLSYYMGNNEPFSWKITRNSRPYQKVKKETGGVYCVIFYGDNGIINKRQYFDEAHNWIRTEYYDNYHENILRAVLSPKHINGVVALKLERIISDEKRETKILYPSAETPEEKCSGVMYSNCGMIWYDTRFIPEDMPEEDDTEENLVGTGFGFEKDSFSYKNNSDETINLSEADYLVNEDLPDIVVENDVINDENTGAEYSAYDKIEKILEEAHKTNKDLFGELITQTAEDKLDISEITLDEEKLVDEIKDEEIPEEPVVLEDISVSDEIVESSENEISDEVEKDEIEILDDPVDELIIEETTEENEQETDLSEIESEENIVDQTSAEEVKEEESVVDDIVDEEPVADEIKEDNLSEEMACVEDVSTQDEIVEESEVAEEITEVEKTSEFEENYTDDLFDKSKTPPCDIVIHTKSGRYSYYGDVDENNCRTGRGRTVTPNGNTSYDGEYQNDKRNGFGVCYYKEGNINYAGNWKDGDRDGCGIGYRLSDGTMHAGKWSNNTPNGYGARFDNEGSFLDLCNYVDGKRNGTGVSIDENGNVVIKKWKDGEVVSEITIRN